MGDYERSCSCIILRMPSHDTSVAVLREFWGDHYQLDWDPQACVFRAVRRDDTETVLEDRECEGLWVKLRSDWVTHSPPG